MPLPDGRLLIPSTRYDELLKTHSEDQLDKLKLVRVHPNFRVIAISVPVPTFAG